MRKVLLHALHCTVMKQELSCRTSVLDRIDAAKLMRQCTFRKADFAVTFPKDRAFVALERNTVGSKSL